MSSNTKSTLKELGKTLLVAFVAFLGSSALLASRLEERVAANREAARQELASAIAVRKAEQQILVADSEQLKAAVRDRLPILKELSKGQADTKEAVARLEVTVSYLAKGQDDIKVQLGNLRK